MWYESFDLKLNYLESLLIFFFKLSNISQDILMTVHPRTLSNLWSSVHLPLFPLYINLNLFRNKDLLPFNRLILLSETIISPWLNYNQHFQSFYIKLNTNCSYMLIWFDNLETKIIERKKKIILYLKILSRFTFAYLSSSVHIVK